MTQRYQTDDGELRWKRAQDILCDLCDGYLGTIEGIDYSHGSAVGEGGLFKLFSGEDDNPDVEPHILGSRLLKSVSHLHGLMSDHTISGEPEEEVLYRMAKFAPLASKLSDQYAMEDQMYRDQWHDDVLSICEAIMDVNRRQNS